MNTWKIAPIATLVITLLAPLPGAAFSLGEITVQSYLGDPFRATIPVQTAPNEEVDISCLNLSPPAPADGMVYLRHAQLSLSRQGGMWQLLISGNNALNEPYLSVFIQSGCQEQGRLVREYTVLIDPATYVEVPQAMEKAPSISKQTVAATPAAGGTSSRASNRRAARSKAKQGTPPIARKKIISHTVPSKDRLKVVSGVAETPAAPGQTEKERMQQREKELTKELDDKTAQFLAMQAQLAKLESKLSEMQKTIELQNRMLAAMQKPSTPAQKTANSWKDYWPAGPGILIAGMIYFFASRSRKRTLENWEPTQRGSNSGKARNPF
ncbi:hypothetical protein SKTS_26470 [Sulfurimicrobium lacus]|uniref:FimV N-terminal domain-containing protein n=2 Tax=Sulfurimicrobium lacus TaxID=2715678 RepID=A0A6F8VF19_9PROT|nr:hypothetical protein SKTS_26470 [Sulfurimicrobium lacus]